MTTNEDFITPVEFAKLLSKLEGKTIPPQMIYNYNRQGLVAFEEIEVTTTRKMITKDEANRIIEKRAARRAAKNEKDQKELATS
jgi:hypothetical protein